MLAQSVNFVTMICAATPSRYGRDSWRVRSRRGILLAFQSRVSLAEAVTMAKRARKGPGDAGKRGKKGRDENGDGGEDNYWQECWDARRAALEKRLGPAGDRIYTSMIPIYLGGRCDVMTFRGHVEGYTYVTAGLTETSAQKKSKLGQYEMMMCTRKASRFAPGLLSDLSNYTLGRAIRPKDTIDMGEGQPKGVTMRALLAMEFDPPRGRFRLMGKKCGLLLLVGITGAELDAYRSGRREQMLSKLKRSVLPYTEVRRKSVV
jgi:hypothetical protein